MLFIYSMWQHYWFSCSKPRRVRKRQVILPQCVFQRGGREFS